MKFEQLIMVLIVLNVMNILVGVSIQYQDITSLDLELSEWFEFGFFPSMDTFSSRVIDEGNYLQKAGAEILQGITNAIQLAMISITIIILVLFLWLTPTHYTMFNSSSEGIAFLKLLGYCAILYFHWFNIMIILRLWKLKKGTDT